MPEESTYVSVQNRRSPNWYGIYGFTQIVSIVPSRFWVFVEKSISFAVLERNLTKKFHLDVTNPVCTKICKGHWGLSLQSSQLSPPPLFFPVWVENWWTQNSLAALTLIAKSIFPKSIFGRLMVVHLSFHNAVLIDPFSISLKHMHGRILSSSKWTQVTSTNGKLGPVSLLLKIQQNNVDDHFKHLW